MLGLCHLNADARRADAKKLCWLDHLEKETFSIACIEGRPYDQSLLPTMRANIAAALCLLLLSHFVNADPNLTSPLSSHQILPANFKPPQVFKNVNLLRNINLEKGYVRETVNVVIENTDSKPHDEYYVPFKVESIQNVGGLEVRDKKDPEKPAFRAENVEYDPYR